MKNIGFTSVIHGHTKIIRALTETILTGIIYLRKKVLMVDWVVTMV